MKYRKKPAVIDAIQWKGDRMELKHFFGDFNRWRFGSIKEIDHVFIDTLEGTHEARLNDWIIKGIKGEFYPCKPDIFKEKYEEAEPPTTDSKKES